MKARTLLHTGGLMLVPLAAPLFTSGFYGYFYDKDLDHHQKVLPEAAVTYILVFTFLQLLVAGPLAFSELYMNFALKESVTWKRDKFVKCATIHAPYWIWILLMLHLMSLVIVIFVKFPGHCYTVIAVWICVCIAYHIFYYIYYRNRTEFDYELYKVKRMEEGLRGNKTLTNAPPEEMKRLFSRRREDGIAFSETTEQGDPNDDTSKEKEDIEKDIEKSPDNNDSGMILQVNGQAKDASGPVCGKCWQPWELDRKHECQIGLAIGRHSLLSGISQAYKNLNANGSESKHGSLQNRQSKNSHNSVQFKVGPGQDGSYPDSKSTIGMGLM